MLPIIYQFWESGIGKVKSIKNQLPDPKSKPTQGSTGSGLTNP